MRCKSFSKISDHQQSVVPAPSRGHPHTPALLVVADFNILILWDIYGILSTNTTDASIIWFLNMKNTTLVQNIKK